MRPVYSKRLLQALLVGPTTQTAEYLVPVGFVAVIKSASFTGTLASWGADLAVRTFPGNVRTVLAGWRTQAFSTSQSWTGFHVLNAGDYLQVVGVGSSNQVTALVSGFLLTVP